MTTTNNQSVSFGRIRFILGITIIAFVFSVTGGIAADSVSVGGMHEQFDARIAFNQGVSQNLTTPQKNNFSELAQKIPDLAFTQDDVMGTVRSLSSHTGFLTEAKTHLKTAAVVQDFLGSNAALFGLNSQDLASFKITDEVYSTLSGATHVYMTQFHEGLPVYNGQLHVNVSPDQRVISVNNSAAANLAAPVNAVKPSIDLATAVMKAAQQLNLPLSNPPKLVNQVAGDVQQTATVDHSGISLEAIEGRLMWLPIRKGVLRLVWNFQIFTVDKQHAYDYTVDAESGKIWTRFDWVAADRYRVYAMPTESPNHVTPLPPGDGRVLASNPANNNASPFNWHDANGSDGAEFTFTRGNNVYAYADADDDNSPDSGSSPNGGTNLNFDFPIDLNRAPSSYSDAAVTNLFYWNNIIHDVQYQYGFDEAAGNFQSNNYGKGGLGGDAVRAEARDGSGINNANFLTPNDGSAPRMQMYLWNRTSPDRDGDLDNGIIIHEYGHGISNRLVGGPSNVNCLTNRQQPGEGLSDWWSLVYTARSGDAGSDPRGIGTYAFGQTATGDGIRTQRYSTDPAINSWTYASINGMRVPHGVGSVWAQAAWEVYWALVDHWGFDPNLYNAQGNAGNQRMMSYVNEGLKNTACNPTFTQVRDGIIDAAKVLHGGEDVCRIWTAFAGFGLGVDAVSGGADSTSPTNGFAVPASCQMDTTPPISSITSPLSGATVSGNTIVTATANDAVGVSNVEFYIDNSRVHTDSIAPFSFTWDTGGVNDGSHTIMSRAYDAAGNVGSSAAVAVTVRNSSSGVANYDAALRAPKCGALANVCSTENLLLGRNGKGPELNQPNTIADSCKDGISGSFHNDESIDGIVLSTLDGGDFAPGKSVRIETKIWAWRSPSADHLDLYYAANANNPNWIFIKSITPTVAGEQTLSATYTLPQGTLQAVRANFRYQQSNSSCSGGNYDDHDDLVFTVKGGVEPEPSPEPGPLPGNSLFNDDFETDKGWIVDPSGTDTASTGQWERGNPEATSSNGPKQLGATVSGVNDLVTGRLAGSSVGSHDIDHGMTSILSPAIMLPVTGDIKLSFHYYFAYFNSSSDDFLRIRIVGNTTSTLFEKRASSDIADGSWTPVSISLNAFAGQTVRILIEVADAGQGSIVEAGIDDVAVTKH